MSHPPLLDEVSTECCCPERASFEPLPSRLWRRRTDETAGRRCSGPTPEPTVRRPNGLRAGPPAHPVRPPHRRLRRGTRTPATDGEAAERVACRASRAHLLLEGRGV